LQNYLLSVKRTRSEGRNEGRTKEIAIIGPKRRLFLVTSLYILYQLSGPRPRFFLDDCPLTSYKQKVAKISLPDCTNKHPNMHSTAVNIILWYQKENFLKLHACPLQYILDADHEQIMFAALTMKGKCIQVILKKKFFFLKLDYCRWQSWWVIDICYC